LYAGATGRFDITNTICLLSNNLFNMYFFLILWWWWVILLGLSFTGLLYRYFRLV
jgi:type II secretory pathway component PulF